MRWQSCPADELVWVPLDDEFVAYHRPSGKTHFLNAASHALLTDILDKPCDLASILDVFDAKVAEPDASAYRTQMNAMLDRLQHLGLINSA